MAKATTTATSSPLTTRKRIATGIGLLVVGLLMYALFVIGTQPGQTATFGMNLGDTAFKIPDLVVPVQPGLYALILIAVFLGAWQFARGGLRSSGRCRGSRTRRRPRSPRGTFPWRSSRYTRG